MAYVFAAIELSEEALFSLRKLRRPVESTSWFDPLDEGDFLAPMRRTWFDEWGYLVLAGSALEEAGIERLDHELGLIECPAVDFSIDRLTFLLDPEPVQICAHVVASRGLEALAQACESAFTRAGCEDELRIFAPLLPLANCFGSTREDLLAYSNEVEPFPAIKVHGDRLLLCSKSATTSMQARAKVDFEYRLR